MKIKINLGLLLFFIFPFIYGQMQDYTYKRELKGIENQWHKIIIPNEVFSHVKHDLSDIRIFEITATDTIESPFILNQNENENQLNKDFFKIINTSYDSSNTYFTLDNSTEKRINEIELNFAEKNFDWRIKLEGGQDNKNWVSIIENYRILSILNDMTTYSFTKLKFPTSSYRYYKITLLNTKAPHLKSASIYHREEKNNTYKNYPIQKLNTQEDKTHNQTELSFKLKLAVPVSHIKLNIDSNFDYYRPINIQYLTDSIKTEKGWIKNYQSLTSEILNSIDKHEFNFQPTIAKDFKIVIQNHHNQPININSIEVKGPQQELIARFNKATRYYLAYGNSQAPQYNYDIEKFKDKIPQNLSALKVGKEEKIIKTIPKTEKPLFENKIWLWLTMLIIILILGWFSFKMIKSKQS